MNTNPAIYEHHLCTAPYPPRSDHQFDTLLGGICAYIGQLCAHFGSYFGFDPSVKFRFKTQWVFIDFIDFILSRGKWKKVVKWRYRMGEKFQKKENPTRIYAIYEHYEHPVQHCVLER